MDEKHSPVSRKRIMLLCGSTYSCTHSKEDQSRGISKAKVFKRKKEAIKLEFQIRWVVEQKNFPWEGYEYFLKQHISFDNKHPYQFEDRFRLNV